MTRRAVLYARVAVGAEGIGKQELDRQLEVCRQHAQSHGWEVVAELGEDERGVSGIPLDRPQLNSILTMARAGQFDVVVVRDLSRLSRDLTDLLVLEKELGQYGLQIASVQQAEEMPGSISLGTIVAELQKVGNRRRSRSVPMRQHKA
ncbi:MAG: recombinase family protein [Anaerolineae bacterium]|nr:recombinase family protein [Anaerolineae bacterium]